MNQTLIHFSWIEDALADLIRAAGAEVVEHAVLQRDRADAIYVFDPVWITDHGAIVLSMGKTLRRGEEQALERRLGELGVPTLFRLDGEARADGGDMFWLDARTLAWVLCVRDTVKLRFFKKERMGTRAFSRYT